MKFLCGSCRTKYQISDEKVRGKILTIRCKKCGAKVLVKESLTRQGGIAIAPLAEEARAKFQVEQEEVIEQAQGRAATGGALSSAFDVAMRAAPDDMPTAIAPTPSIESEAGIEWYTASGGQQTGPFAYAELVQRIKDGSSQPRHYVWRDGYDGWKRIRDVPDLAQFIPHEKRKPPPPPPAPVELPRDNVVDFASRRAQRDRVAGLVGDEEPTKQEPVIGATALGEHEDSDRSEQLDNVLNEALGIEGEGATTQASPEGATPKKSVNEELAALGSSAAIFTSTEESSVPSAVPEDLFDMVPRASSSELVARESTRFFVQAAGVNNQKSKNRAGLLAILGGILVVVAFFGLWGAGIIEINIPGLGNPFARAEKDKVEDEEAIEDAELSAEELAQLKLLKGAERRKYRAQLAKKRTTAKGRSKGGSGELGYVDDANASGGSRGTRVGDATSLNIELPGEGKVANAQIGASDLPGANVDDIPLPDTGRLDEGAITSVVKSNQKAVAICYQRALKGNGQLDGKLEFEVTVQPDGSVSKARVETSKFQGTELARCISSKIKDWRFPSFNGAAQKVVIPFYLQRGASY